MTYEELLQLPQWHEKCHEILSRDGFICKKCGAIGYHADLIQEFSDICDINSCLNGFKINDMTLSEFIIDDMKYDKRLSFPTVLWEESPSKRHGYNLYRCGSFQFGKAALIRTKQLLSTYEEDMNDHESYKKQSFKVKIRVLSEFHAKVNLPNGLDTTLESMTSIIFNENISENAVLSIERVPNTGGCATLSGYATTWGSILVSITYKNYAVSFYLREIRDYENDENGHSDFHKPLLKSVKTRGLNIHHSYYVKGNLPWDYDNDALLTLCETCHKKMHKEAKTPIYKSIVPKPLVDSYATICDRCEGGGYLPQYDYYCNGICFKCWGEGVLLD